MTEQMLERVINHCMKELDFIWWKGVVGYIIPSITFSEFFLVISTLLISALKFFVFLNATKWSESGKRADTAQGLPAFEFQIILFNS